MHHLIEESIYIYYIYIYIDN